MDSSQLGAIVNALKEPAAQGVNPRKMQQEEIEQLIQAAALIGNGRARGGTDEQIIGEFARKLVRERDRRGNFNEGQGSAVERLLKAEGLAPEDIDAKSNRQILQDDAEFGFAFEDDAQLAADGRVTRDRNARQREGLRKVRKQKAGERRDARIQKIQDRIENNNSQQKIFDFGLIPIAGEDEDPINNRERGRLVRRGDQVFFEQGGGFVEGPNGRIEIPAKRVAWDGQRDERGEPILPDNIRMNPNLPVAMNDEGMQQLKEQDRAQGASEARRVERFMRDDLDSREMGERARLAAGKMAPEEELIRAQGPAQRVARANGNGYFEAPPLAVRVDPRGNIQRREKVGEGGKENRNLRPGVGQQAFDADVAQEAILGHLQARKAARGDGRRQAIIRGINDQQARAYASELLLENNQPGQNVRAQINNLGGVKDKAADMGLQLGNQKTMLGQAQRVQRSDGSFEFVDRAGNPLYNPAYKEGQGTNSAQVLNAPDGGQNVIDWIKKNEFEDRGAQNFGDEAILAQFADKGAGGGIEQVDIGGAIGGFEEKVAKRLGIDPKRVGNIKGAQAAINAVIAGERERGNAFVNLVDNEKVVVQNPGVPEAMMAMKIPPAEQQQIANALKQRELAEFARFDPRVPIDSAITPGPNPANVFFGLDDPKRGGDRLDIAKDVKFQGKVQRYGRDEAGRPVEGEAARPFVGQIGKARAPGFDQVRLGADGQAMDPVDVRVMMEERNRGNREKVVARKAKAGKKQIFGPADDRREVGKIRAMQEGNVFAQVRADRAAAMAAAAPKQDFRGKFIPGENVSIPGDFAEPRGGFRKVVPGLARKGNAQLQPRPVRPQENRNVVQVDVPPVSENFVSKASRNKQISDRMRQEIASDVVQKQDRRRRLGTGAGISAAVLGTLLGLGNMNREEEEQMV